MLFFVEILTPLGKVSQNTAPSFLENLNLWYARFHRFVIQKWRKIKWNCENVMLTTRTVCKHCWHIRYEIDMGPELSAAAADQSFVWICKQHQDLIGSVLIFRTKIIWSGPEFGLVSKLDIWTQPINWLPVVIIVYILKNIMATSKCEGQTFLQYQVLMYGFYILCGNFL